MTTEKKRKLTSSYTKHFRKKLVDREFCLEYLNAALDEANDPNVSPEEFLVTLISCLREIIYANGGIDKFIEKYQPDLTRQTLSNIFRSPDEERPKNGLESVSDYNVAKACLVALRASKA